MITTTGHDMYIYIDKKGRLFPSPKKIDKGTGETLGLEREPIRRYSCPTSEQYSRAFVTALGKTREVLPEIERILA